MHGYDRVSEGWGWGVTEKKRIEYPDIVARCDKCGRAYVWVAEDRQAANPPECLDNRCDGKVIMLEKPERSPYYDPDCTHR
jgi:hypothetical protein